MKQMRELVLQSNELLTDGSQPEVIFVDTGILPDGELMPGIVLFNAPVSYIPVRAFVRCGADLERFTIEDSEQTVIFASDLIREGDAMLLPAKGICPAHLPTLNLSYSGREIKGVRVIVEYCHNPLTRFPEMLNQ